MTREEKNISLSLQQSLDSAEATARISGIDDAYNVLLDHIESLIEAIAESKSEDDDNPDDDDEEEDDD